MSRTILSVALPVFLVTMMISSCTERIDVDLNSSEPQIVIEGNVTTDSVVSIIKITKSVNFDESNVLPTIQNAIVELSDNMGNVDILTETSPGMYISETLTGSEGRTYSILVQAEDKTFTSYSSIPNKVKFDSLIITKTNGSGGPFGPGHSSNYDVSVKYTDPADETNFYSFVEFVNGKKMKRHVINDRLTNGQVVIRTLMSFNRILNSSDVLQVEMQCIDEAVYEYFSSFGNLQGGPGNSSTPANPYSNIEGAELGYFSAHTSEIKQETIQ